MSSASRDLGRRAEDLAATHLASRGYRIVARNARPGEVRGELDVIAVEGRTLVFIEVKAGRVGAIAGPEKPAAAVGARKRAKLRSLAVAWLRANEGRVPAYGQLRFDVIGIRLDDAGAVAEWEHLRGAF